MTKHTFRKKVIALDLSGSFTYPLKKATNSQAEQTLKAIDTIFDTAPKDMDINVICWGAKDTIGVYNYSNKTSPGIRHQVSAAMAKGLNSGTEIEPLINHYRNLLKQSDETDLIIVSDGDFMDVNQAVNSLKVLKTEFPMARISYISTSQKDSMSPHTDSNILELSKRVPGAIDFKKCNIAAIEDNLTLALYCHNTIHTIRHKFNQASKEAEAFDQLLKSCDDTMLKHNGCKPS